MFTCKNQVYAVYICFQNLTFALSSLTPSIVGSLMLGSVIELHEKIANKDTEIHSLDPRNCLFNGQEESDYLFGQGIINEESINDKDYLVLYESWCLFIYREFYKNLLAILDEVSLGTFGEKQTGIPNSFLQCL